MIYPIYAVRDNLVGFLRPITEINDAVAMRNFRDAFAQLPEASKSDYSLFKIGEFNDKTGEVTALLPTVVCHATDFTKDGDVDEV